VLFLFCACAANEMMRKEPAISNCFMVEQFRFCLMKAGFLFCCFDRTKKLFRRVAYSIPVSLRHPKLI
jgi:hypothetical protein